MLHIALKWIFLSPESPIDPSANARLDLEILNGWHHGFACLFLSRRLKLRRDRRGNLWLAEARRGSPIDGLKPVQRGKGSISGIADLARADHPHDLQPTPSDGAQDLARIVRLKVQDVLNPQIQEVGELFAAEERQDIAPVLKPTISEFHPLKLNTGDVAVLKHIFPNGSLVQQPSIR